MTRKNKYRWLRLVVVFFGFGFSAVGSSHGWIDMKTVIFLCTMSTVAALYLRPKSIAFVDFFRRDQKKDKK